MSCLLQHRGEQRMLRRVEGIHHRNASPGKSVLEILAKEQAALLVGGYRKDQRVPDRHLVIRGQIERRAHCFERGVGDIERIGPTQDGGSRLCRRAARFADEDPVKLPECLGRNNDQMYGQARDKIARGLATSRISHPFGVGHDIGVERNARHVTYS